MNVTCPECQSVFRVDPAKVPATGVRARCSVCGGVILVAAGTLAASVTPSGRATSGGGRAVQHTTPAVSTSHVPPARPQATPAAAAASMQAAYQPPTSAAAGAPAGVGVATPAGSPARKSINPFLNADPQQRARRLARALVSDLVAYHPQKREEGLRDGTLRQLFRDEIKKSYEEFAEQVGRDVAQSSTHFQDALNEVLAGGRKLF